MEKLVHANKLLHPSKLLEFLLLFYDSFTFPVE